MKIEELNRQQVLGGIHKILTAVLELVLTRRKDKIEKRLPLLPLLSRHWAAEA